MQTAVNKAIRVGRATLLAISLGVSLALVLGLATTALAAVPGDPFKLGRFNTVNALSTLVGNRAGPMLVVDNNSTAAGARALDLRVEPGKAPMAVNSATRVPDLNADRIDGRDSSDFALRDPETGAAFEANIARDADRLDGKDSTQFASGTNGKANDADKLDGKDSTSFFSGKTYVNSSFATGSTGGGEFVTLTTKCDPGDVAMGGGGALLASFDTMRSSIPNSANSWSETFVDSSGPSSFQGFVQCADFPPLR